MGEELRAQVLERLRTIVDPETEVDVVRMQLIGDLMLNEEDVVHYKFCLSSPLCPIAVSLALTIREAVAEVEGVTPQEVEVADYINAEKLSDAGGTGERVTNREWTVAGG